MNDRVGFELVHFSKRRDGWLSFDAPTASYISHGNAFPEYGRLLYIWFPLEIRPLTTQATDQIAKIGPNLLPLSY